MNEYSSCLKEFDEDFYMNNPNLLLDFKKVQKNSQLLEQENYQLDPKIKQHTSTVIPLIQIHQPGQIPKLSDQQILKLKKSFKKSP